MVTTFSAIIAIDKLYGIGLNGDLPWPKCPEDMADFKAITLLASTNSNNYLIVGRKTYESIPNRLIGRQCLVIANNKPKGLKEEDRYISVDPIVAETVICSSTEGNLTLQTHNDVLRLLEFKSEPKDLIIIGGAQIYRMFLPVITFLRITKFEKAYQCDTYFEDLKILEEQQSKKKKRFFSYPGKFYYDSDNKPIAQTYTMRSYKYYD
jgi:dihydrofolate reductase